MIKSFNFIKKIPPDGDAVLGHLPGKILGEGQNRSLGRGVVSAAEVLGLPQQLDRTVFDDKAAWAKTFQDLTAATGTDWNIEQVLEITGLT